MDILSVLGISLGLGVVYYVMADGGITALLFNINAFILVFGGTLASTLITFPWSILKNVPKVVLFIIIPQKKPEIQDVIEQMLSLLTISLSQGMDALSEESEKITDTFLKDGIRMLVEDQDEETISDNLYNEMAAMRQRHEKTISVFRSMGTYAPIFGLLGTLIGVVQVLKNLSDPSSMGQSMAIAIATTFYGIFGTNFIFLPIAGKLDAHSHSEVDIRELYMLGLIAIRQRMVPVLLRRKLESYLSEGNRRARTEAVTAEE